MTHGIDTSVLVASEIGSHSNHKESRTLLERLVNGGDRLAMTPPVLAEFVHIVTDPRRFATPIAMDVALDRAEQIWNSPQAVQLFPSTVAAIQFFSWMRQHGLGRKRILDTFLAATFFTEGVLSIITLNRSDFEICCFSVVEP